MVLLKVAEFIPAQQTCKWTLMIHNHINKLIVTISINHRTFIGSNQNRLLI
jgi:hypothetical protein